MFAKKGQEVSPEKYWPLDMDDEVSEIKNSTKKEKENGKGKATLEASDFLNLFASLGNG